MIPTKAHRGTRYEFDIEKRYAGTKYSGAQLCVTADRIFQIHLLAQKVFNTQNALPLFFCLVIVMRAARDGIIPSISYISAELGWPRSTTDDLIRNFELDGMIERQRFGRVVTPVATAKGRTLMLELMEKLTDIGMNPLPNESSENTDTGSLLRQNTDIGSSSVES